MLTRFLDRCGLIALVFLLAACSARRTEITAIGDPDRGALIVDRQACGSCHTQVPLNRRSQMRAGTLIDFCESCGVILYAADELG